MTRLRTIDLATASQHEFEAMEERIEARAEAEWLAVHDGSEAGL